MKYADTIRFCKSCNLVTLWNLNNATNHSVCLTCNGTYCRYPTRREAHNWRYKLSKKEAGDD